jgi:hypothetical protein
MAASTLPVRWAGRQAGTPGETPGGLREGTTGAAACPSYAVSGVSEEPQPLPPLPGLEFTGPASADKVDPELLGLPDPPRRARTLTVLLLALAAGAALLATLSLRREVSYALDGVLSGDPPVALGNLTSASSATLAASENRPVRGEGMLGAAGGIRYERPFVEDSFRTLPVAGRAEPFDMWVEVRVPAGQESGRWQPPRTFSGRLVRLDAAGPRHRGLRAAIEGATHEPVPKGAWLLVDGEDPVDARWSIVLSLMFLGFVAWNVAATVRILKKIRA